MRVEAKLPACLTFEQGVQRRAGHETCAPPCWLCLVKARLWYVHGPVEEIVTTRVRTRSAGVAQNAQFQAAFERVQRTREIARSQPDFVRRFDAVTTLRATASSQNIEGGNSTLLGVARAVRDGGESLDPSA
jgi:hypothetical protein